MNVSRTPHRFIYLVLVGVLLAACQQTPAPQEEPTLSAQATTTTIDFGTLDNNDFQSYTEDGFTLTPVLNGGNTASGFVRVSSFLSPGDSHAAPNFGFDDQDIILTKDAAQPFSLSSIDLIETNVSPSPRTATIQGTQTNGNVVEQTFTTDGVAGRQTFLLSTFTDLISVRLGAGASMGEVSVDNLILGVGAADTTAPVITITTPSGGAQYLLNESVLADYTCEDETGGSGIASCIGAVANGAAIDTGTVGNHSFTVNAEDDEGNTAELTHNYSVVYDFSGFFQPVDNPGSEPTPIFNRAKAGSGIPVKFSLGGNQGLSILSSGSPTSRQVPCDAEATVDPIEQTVTAGNSSLQYDAATNTYSYVWKTDKSWANTCRVLTVTLNDGTEHLAYFRFTK